MKKISIINIPSEFEYPDNVKQLQITKNGDVITLKPVDSNWLSLADFEKSDDDFLAERVDVTPKF